MTGQLAKTQKRFMMQKTNGIPYVDETEGKT